MAVDGDHGTTTGQVRLGRHTFPVSCESLDAALAALESLHTRSA